MNVSPQGIESSQTEANSCTKCGAVVIPGSVHCVKCGNLLGATEADPDRPLRKVFTWWLLCYGFWRIVGIVSNGLAAHRSTLGSDAWLFSTVMCVICAVSLSAIATLWTGRKWGLFLFIAAEVTAGLWAFLFVNLFAPVFAILPIAIMWFVSKRANFRRS